MRETVSPRGVVSGIFCGLLFWKSVPWALSTSNITWAEYSVVLIVVAFILLGPLALAAAQEQEKNAESGQLDWTGARGPTTVWVLWGPK